MKIAVIGSKGLPPKQGGIEHHCAEIYSRIVNRGHSVDLFSRSSYNGSSCNHRYHYKGVQVISLPCLKLRGVDALTSSALAAILSCKKHYDVIHFHALGPSLFTCLPKILSTSKIIVTCHGLDWQRGKWGKLSSFLIRAGEKAAVRFADEIIVVSEELQTYFQNTYGRTTTYIGNGPASYAESDPDFTYGSSLNLEQKRYIVFLGRLVPEKCPDLLIQAFQNLRPKGWKLVVVGGDSDTSTFTTKLLNLSTGNKDIVFTGELKGGRLAEIMRGAGLFVLPSMVEGLPLALLEAMSEGIPVLASHIPVHLRLIEQERGALFKAGDLDSLIFWLNWAIHHSQEMAIRAERAKHYVHTHHNWDRIASECLELYTATASNSPIPVPDRQPIY